MPQHLRDQFGDELLSSVLRHRNDIACIAPLNHGVDRDVASTFCVIFRDGDKIKVRRLASNSTAEELRRHISSLPRELVPHVLAVDGSVMLEEWIEGTPIDEDDDEVLLVVGRLLGRIHTENVRSVAGHSTPSMDSLNAKLESLSTSGLIDSRVARQLATAASWSAPSSLDVGVVHRDICPENLLRSNDGRIVIIDNGSVTLGFYDEDIARACFRWPLNEKRKASFLRGYADYRDPATFNKAEQFWKIWVVVESAIWRSNHASKSLPACCQLLERMAKDDP